MYLNMLLLILLYTLQLYYILSISICFSLCSKYLLPQFFHLVFIPFLGSHVSSENNSH